MLPNNCVGKESLARMRTDEGWKQLVNENLKREWSDVRWMIRLQAVMFTVGTEETEQHQAREISQLLQKKFKGETFVNTQYS